MKRRTKIISILLSLVLVTSSLGFDSLASEAEIESGKQGLETTVTGELEADNRLSDGSSVTEESDEEALPVEEEQLQEEVQEEESVESAESEDAISDKEDAALADSAQTEEQIPSVEEGAVTVSYDEELQNLVVNWKEAFTKENEAESLQDYNYVVEINDKKEFVEGVDEQGEPVSELLVPITSAADEESVSGNNAADVSVNASDDATANEETSAAGYSVKVFYTTRECLNEETEVLTPVIPVEAKDDRIAAQDVNAPEVSGDEEQAAEEESEKTVSLAALSIQEDVAANTVEEGFIGCASFRPLTISGTLNPVATVAADQKSITITWNAVSTDVASATVTYEVYRNAETTPIYTGTACTCTDAAVVENTSYTYTVKAKDGTSPEVVAATAAVKTGYIAPAAPTKLIGTVLKNKIELSWKAVSGATGYQVRVDDGSWIDVGANLLYTFKADFGVYPCEVRAYRGTTDYVSAPAEVKVNFADTTKAVRTMSFSATVISTCNSFKTAYSGKKAGKVAAGTKVTAYQCYGGRFKCQLPSGKYVWINKAKLKLHSHHYTKGRYDQNTLESYANNRGFSSKTKYLIWISQYTQTVTIYTGKKGNWRVERSVKVATGTYKSHSPTGTFKVGQKEKGWFYKTTYEAPVVHYCGMNSFHSRIKSNRAHNRGKLVDARIGKPVSKGCIRMYDEDLQFIYKKVPKGTTVISY